MKTLSSLHVHALRAVVDKLPMPQFLGNSGDIHEDVLQRRRNPPTWDTGYEGMTYATLPSIAAVEPPQSSSEGGSISFLTLEGSDNDIIFNDTLRLPLANTIFQTGSPTTMTYSSWRGDAEKGKLTLDSWKDLNQFGIRLPQHDDTNQVVSALAIPLVPLHLPRVVTASMGNVLRQINDEGTERRSVPASQELERLVPQYFKSRGEPSRPVTVWALIIPECISEKFHIVTHEHLKRVHVKENIDQPVLIPDVWDALWRSNPVVWDDTVSLALTKGARLHRVLSGGGGWGKKAGLLSLDPISIGFKSAILTKTPSEELPEQEDLSSVLHPVAEPGDLIQFFLSPTQYREGTSIIEETPLKVVRPTESSSTWTWEFGTIPSTTDAAQQSSSQHNHIGEGDLSEVLVLRNSFGALTEGAMYFTRKLRLSSSDSFSAVSGSKVDVPFSRFSSVNYYTGSTKNVCSPLP